MAALLRLAASRPISLKSNVSNIELRPIKEAARSLTGAFTYCVQFVSTMNALLRYCMDEYPEAENDELAMLARAIFADTDAYVKEIDSLLQPVSKYSTLPNVNK